MYLVVVRCSMDDIPVKMFFSREDAIQCARTLDVQAAAERGEAIFGFNASTPELVSVVDFVDGLPQCVSNIRDLSE